MNAYEATICDVSGILACDNGNITIQEYRQRYFYISKMTDQTGSSNRSSYTAHSRSLQPNESDVSISVILPRKNTKFATTPTQRKCPLINVPLTDNGK